MSNKPENRNTSLDSIKNEATRQRWELFHRAIAHAKQSNVATLMSEYGVEEVDVRAPLQSVAR